MEQRVIRVAQIMGRMMGGGLEATIMNHYRHIDHSRVQFDFVIDDDSFVVPREEIESLGGRVFVVPAYRHLPAYLKALRELFTRIKPDIVHSNLNALSVFPLSAAKKAGVPIRVAHSHSTSNPAEKAKNAMKMALKPFSRVYPTAYMACSTVAARWLFGDQLVDAGKVKILKNAIDIDRFSFDARSRAERRAEFGVSDDQLVIGAVGRMCFQKNQLFTLDVFAEVLRRRPDAVLVLAGDGDMMDAVRKRIDELGIEQSVRVLGVRNDMPQLYQAFDVLAFPSNYEGLGMAAVEAQTSGMPVIASDQVPSEASIVPGLMKQLPLGDAQADFSRWADALCAVNPIGDRPDEKAVVAAAGYDIDASAADLCGWYEALVRDRRGV